MADHNAPPSDEAPAPPKDQKALTEEEIVESFQFLEHLATRIPAAIRAKPKEEQMQFLLEMANSFRRHQAGEEDYKQLHTEYKRLIQTQYKHLHPHLLDSTKYVRCCQRLCCFSEILNSFAVLFPTHPNHVVLNPSHHPLGGNGTNYSYKQSNQRTKSPFCLCLKKSPLGCSALTCSNLQPAAKF